jgi:hypothetical protein
LSSNKPNQTMGLGHLPAQNRHNDNGYATIFDGTWGHMAPQKNVSYKGVVRFTMTDHSQYGCQPIILQYDFPNLEGPYIHDALFDAVCDWETDNLAKGAVYERIVTFRNYRFYLSNIKLITPPFSIKNKAQLVTK